MMSISSLTRDFQSLAVILYLSLIVMGSPALTIDTANTSQSLEYAILSEGKEVSIWIDLPNAFPWRHCLQEYKGLLAPIPCDQNSMDQRFLISVLPGSGNGRRFVWKTRDWSKCIVPGKVKHEDEWKQSVKLVSKAEYDTGHWLWTDQAQFRWSQGCGKCVQSYKYNTPVQFQFCKDYAEDQNLEMGVWTDGKLTPLDTEAWQHRQNVMRTHFMETELPGLRKAVDEVDIDDMLHAYDKKVEPGKRRRAAVFYVDEGSTGISQVNWWVYTWRFIGLNSPDQGFDLVMMTHPAVVDKLPPECVIVPDNFRIFHNNSGQCLYKPYLGIAHRDKAFDRYLNSQECLFGPGSEFLSQYTLLLRADLDTFPTPRLLDWWPDGVIVNKHCNTNFGLDSIKSAIKTLSCSAGIDHQGWFNPGSTWYGDARSVRNMAKITVALNNFGRAQMFGPGTMCRCSDCSKMPEQCQWGGGPYAGTMLLYLQEIAVNKVMTQAMWDNLPSGLLDQGVADNSKARSVCQPALLHCMHNADRFSKLAFGRGSYKDEDMSGLDITKVRDYATFMALTPNNQGKGGEEALEAFFAKVGGNTPESNASVWKQFCQETES